MPTFDLNRLSVERHLNGKLHKISGDMPLTQGMTDVSAVADFLSAHAAELQLGIDPKALKLVHQVDTPVGKVYRYQKTVDGVPVHNAFVIVQVDHQARVRHIEVSHNAHLLLAADAGGGQDIGAQAAEAKALQSLGDVTLRATRPAPERVYFSTDAGLRLAYQVLVLTREPMHDWRIFVDAETGAILDKKDILKSTDGSGQVFNPNPVVTANNNTLRQPTATIAGGCAYAGSSVATIDAQRQVQVLKDLTLTGGVYTLSGPYAKIINIDAPMQTVPTEAVATDFNYSSSDERLGGVNLYYHMDTLQRYIQSLGITTANNRQMNADPASTALGYSAFYSPGDKSLHMGVSRPCHPDKAQEADAIIHEYGHAIQDNQVPGWGGTNPGTGRDEAGAMGEGFGDTLACVYFATYGNGFQRETFEDWAYVENGAAGLRRVDGTKIYPTDWSSEVHNDGEIWSSALWNIYRAIGGDSLALADKQAARDTLLKSVILSHHLLAPDATMPDGAEAVMTTHAELDDSRGRYLTQMLDSFHARGLLHCDAAADLYLRDDTTDPGTEPFGGSVFWESPDLWVRNADDGGLTHQDPEFGQDNYFYARVKNHGTVAARAFVVTFNVKPWAGVQFVYPGDFVPFVSAVPGFNLAPGTSMIVKAKWPQALIPPTGTHACLLGQVYTPVDTSPAGSHVWDKNNLAQKNMTIVDASPDEAVLAHFQIGTLHEPRPDLYAIELIRPPGAAAIRVALMASSSAETRKLFHSADKFTDERPNASPAAPMTILRFADHTSAELSSPTLSGGPLRLNFAPGSSIDIRDSRNTPDAPVKFKRTARLIETPGQPAEIVFNEGRVSGFPIYLQPRSQLKCSLKVLVPKEARPGESIKLQLLQRMSNGKIGGGITLVINVKAKH